MKSGYEYYSNLINDAYNNSLNSLKDYSKLVEEEIEKAREESESKHLNNEKNYIDEYLKEYSDKLNTEIAEKMNMLTEAKEELDDMVRDSFDNLESSFNDALIRFEEETSSKVLDAIEKLEKETESVLFKKYMSVLNEKIRSVNEKLDNETSDLKEKYADLNSDLNNAINMMKNSVIDKDQLISLHSDENNTIIEKLEKLKNDFQTFRESSLRFDNEDVPALFDDKKKEIERIFEEFTSVVLDRLNITDDEVNKLKDTIISDKLNLLEKMDNLEVEIETVKKDNTIEQLALEKKALEDSFNTIKEDFAKLGNLESNLYQLKENMSDVDILLKDEVKALSNRLSDFEDRIKDDIVRDLDEYSIELNNLTSNVGKLNLRIDGIKEQIENSINKSSELENLLSKEKEELDNKLSSIKDDLISKSENSDIIEQTFIKEKEELTNLFNQIREDNKDFRYRLEKRISYFEDTWSDSGKLKNIFSADIKEELNDIRNANDIKINNSIGYLKDKIESIDNDISNWKENGIEELVKQLKEARESISNYLDDSEIKGKEVVYSILLSGREYLEKYLKEYYSELESQLYDKMNLSKIDLDNILKSSFDNLETKFNES
ncbi:hypothetical protein H263_15672, partial [Brachyspira hampsonii 30599]